MKIYGIEAGEEDPQHEVRLTDIVCVVLIITLILILI